MREAINKLLSKQISVGICSHIKRTQHTHTITLYRIWLSYAPIKVGSGVVGESGGEPLKPETCQCIWRAAGQAKHFGICA